MDNETYTYDNGLSTHSMMGTKLAQYNDMKSRDNGLYSCVERLVRLVRHWRAFFGIGACKSSCCL